MRGLKNDLSTWTGEGRITHIPGSVAGAFTIRVVRVDTDKTAYYTTIHCMASGGTLTYVKSLRLKVGDRVMVTGFLYLDEHPEDEFKGPDLFVSVDRVYAAKSRQEDSNGEEG